GGVEWSGEDLNAEGLIAYMFDIIYVTWFVHVLSILFEWIWWFYLVIPIFSGYKIWTVFIKPMFANNGDEFVSQEKSKRQAKKEKRPSVKYLR
ncbi:5574_t:CDS:2, partial [Acaulospora morrowiae]